MGVFVCVLKKKICFHKLVSFVQLQSKVVVLILS